MYELSGADDEEMVVSGKKLRFAKICLESKGERLTAQSHVWWKTVYEQKHLIQTFVVYLAGQWACLSCSFAQRLYMYRAQTRLSSLRHVTNLTASGLPRDESGVGGNAAQEVCESWTTPGLEGGRKESVCMLSHNTLVALSQDKFSCESGAAAGAEKLGVYMCGTFRVLLTEGIVCLWGDITFEVKLNMKHTWMKLNSLQLMVPATEGREVTASRESNPRAMMPTERYNSILHTSSSTQESSLPISTWTPSTFYGIAQDQDI